MKKYFIGVILLLFAFQANAATTVSGRPCPGGVEAVVTDYCTSASACTSPNPGECAQGCEDFEGATSCYSGYDSNCQGTSAYLTVKAGDTVDFTSAHSGTLSCNDKGSYALDMNIAAASSTTIYRLGSLGGTTKGYVQFYFNLVSHGALATTEYVALMRITDAGYTTRSYIALYMSGTDLKMQLMAESGTTTVGSTTISTGTWYRIGLALDQTADTAILYLNGSAEITISNYTGSSALAYGYFGPASYNNLAAYRVQFDNIAVDASALPEACN